MYAHPKLLNWHLTFSRRSEPEKLAERYCKFNIQALLSTAISAAGNSARSCTAVDPEITSLKFAS
jgi:hypothetical protein